MKHVLVGSLIAMAPMAAQAALVDLELTANWVAADYDVSSTGPSGSTAAESDDGAVFGVAPSDGSLSLTLRVQTNSADFFAAGTGGRFHDFYGYSDVEILGGTFTYGSATWSTSDIINLEGPNPASANLWTDTDLESGDPTRVSFRMIADWFDANADIFFGSRTGTIADGATQIRDNFSMSEYFAGERISVSASGYTATVTPAVPLPSSTLLLLGGLAGLAGLRRKRG